MAETEVIQPESKKDGSENKESWIQYENRRNFGGKPDFFEKNQDKNPLTPEECKELAQILDDLIRSMQLEGTQNERTITKNGQKITCVLFSEKNKDVLEAAGQIEISKNGSKEYMEIGFSKEGGKYRFIATEFEHNKDAQQAYNNLKKEIGNLEKQKKEAEKKAEKAKDAYETAANEVDALTPDDGVETLKKRQAPPIEAALQRAIETKQAWEAEKSKVIAIERKMTMKNGVLRDTERLTQFAVDQAHASFGKDKDDEVVTKSYNGGVIAKLFKEKATTIINEAEKSKKEEGKEVVDKFAYPEWKPKAKNKLPQTEPQTKEADASKVDLMPPSN